MTNMICEARTIYANYGMLGHTKQPIYTDTPCVESGLYDELSVSLPSGWTWSESKNGKLLVCAPDDTRYLVPEVIVHLNDSPSLRWYDNTGSHRIKLNGGK